MMQQALDFRAASDALHDLVAPLADADFARPTGFKGWTIDAILRHLHVWNQAADMSLRDAEAFNAFFAEVKAYLGKGGLPVFEAKRLDGLSGQALVATWRDFYGPMAERFAEADPSARVVWAGPGMSVRSSITARLMETWAHGQAIYDLLGIVRENEDWIKNVVVIGVNTYGWTFKVRGQTPPDPMPWLSLTAPSGEIWTFGEENAAERIEGLAEEFAQVVTQTRNIADTALAVTGPNAAAWMAAAQCFAGGPEAPPAPGTRRTAGT